MRKIVLVFLSLFLYSNLYAEDKLDMLDKQSKEFFNAITGLEKDYLEEQLQNIKKKADQKVIQNNVRQVDPTVNFQSQSVKKQISEEEYEKTVFKHENEMARLTTDFTRTKKLKDIKIKSMYSFNGKNYVVLKLDDDKSTSSTDETNELSLSVEGRYSKGDYILTHRITKINTQTKTVELYKKLDEEYGYSIYLSNYGISVSDLKKRAKPVEKKKEEPKKVEVKESKQNIKEAFKKVRNKPIVKKETKKVNVNECLYTVQFENLNVRNSNNLDATILRVLKKNDQFTIQNKKGQWVHLDTIYKNKSGDVMAVENKNNWLQIIDENVSTEDKNCL